jgi:hypothetical protein
MLNKKAQTKTKSLSPFSVTMGEIASIVTPKEIQDYRDKYNIQGQSLSEIGNHFAIRDDAKRVILAKLLGDDATPNLLIGEAIDDLVETKITLWETEEHSVDLPYSVGNLSANQIRDLYMDDLRKALKYALRDMVDEAAYLAEAYVRNRVAPSGGSTPEENLEILDFAHHQLDKYGLGDISLLDFDRERNEELIKSKREQAKSKKELAVDKEAYYVPLDEYMERIDELRERADYFLQEADNVQEGSYDYKGLLQRSVNALNKAIMTCDLSISYYTDIKDKIGGNFIEYVSDLMEIKKELKEERETIFEFITLYDEEKIADKKMNWYKLSQRYNESS